MNCKKSFPQAIMCTQGCDPCMISPKRQQIIMWDDLNMWTVSNQVKNDIKNIELFIINLKSKLGCLGIGERSMMKVLNHENRDNLIFKPWQLAAIRAVEYSGETPIGSKAVLDYVIGETHERISRASIIVFLESMRAINLISGVEQTGKGGMRFAYVLPLDRAFFDQQALMIVLDKLVREFPEAEHMAAIRLVKEHIESETAN